MTTTLKCGDYRCTQRNSPVESFVDDLSHTERSKGVQPKPTLKNLRCRFHTGVLKRSRYRSDPLPLSDADRTRLLAEQAKVDAKERAEAEAQRKENAVKAEERRRAEWAEMDLPAGHTLTLDTERHSAKEEPTYTGQVWLGETQPTERWDNRWLNVEPTHRYYGPIPEGREYPFVIRVTRGSTLTPNEARELAALLIESAAKAEELNAGKAPA